MAEVKNAMALVEQGKKQLNPLYTMTFDNIHEIKDSSEDNFDLLCNGFYFGYMQGMKAAKAEMKRKGANV